MHSLEVSHNSRSLDYGKPEADGAAGAWHHLDRRMCLVVLRALEHWGRLERDDRQPERVFPLPQLLMTLYAVFGDVSAAGRVKDELARSGIERIAMSRCLTEDSIAAEAPGQPYANQPGQRSEESDSSPYVDAILSGAVVLTVEVATARQARSAVEVARRNEAYRLILRRMRRFSISTAAGNAIG
jgi:hypothetical protein